MTKAYIGTSGWTSSQWKQVFYPRGLKPKDYLSFYTQHFPTVEVNSTYWRLPSVTAINNWFENSPDDFSFSVKVPKRLINLQEPHKIKSQLHFFAGRLMVLRHKFKFLLYQFPAKLKNDASKLENYLKALPENTQNMIEFRDNSWNNTTVLNLLSNYKTGYVVANALGLETKWAQTTNCIYLRLHGSQKWYTHNYLEEELQELEQKISGFLEQKVPVYVYFSNDYHGYSVANAARLKTILEG